MDTAHRHLRIAFVATRDLTRHNGRTPTLRHVIRTLQRHHSVHVLRLHSILELRRTRDFAAVLLSWLKSLALCRPLPLQCLLYAAPRECARLVAEIRATDCDAVYLDTVRCQLLLRSLRRVLPDLHVVTDFDDLMSRRAACLRQRRLPFLAGHLGQHFPRWLRFLVEVSLAPPITAYEASTLPQAEKEVAAASNAAILVSTVERRMLERRMRRGPATSLRCIPPAFAAKARPWRNASSLRFVFIGSDRQLQNRTAIDFLLETWRTLRPSTELHLYGRQYRATPDVAGVRWHGFVDDLSLVYQAGSIALVPALISGGIKTKVTEAWAWGCPVLCNDDALEGLAVPDYPLALPESRWPSCLRDPLAYADVWARAAWIGHAFVRKAMSPDIFELAWERVMQPTPSGKAFLAPTGGNIAMLGNSPAL